MDCSRVVVWEIVWVGEGVNPPEVGLGRAPVGVGGGVPVAVEFAAGNGVRDGVIPPPDFVLVE